MRTYCARVAREKKAAHREETYWGKPVPGFGDPRGRLLVLGLAPAAHGANRTGRVFTGDGSSDFLMRAMHRHGFVTISTSRQAGDGLRLVDAYIATAVRCAPPANKPTSAELEACLPYLTTELQLLNRVSVIVALGHFAFDAYVRVLAQADNIRRPNPKFGHGLIYRFPGTPTIVASYHPSRQNTNTGRLTPVMLEHIFRRAHGLIHPRQVRERAATARTPQK